MAIIGSWTFAANGNGAWVNCNHASPLTFHAQGTFGSGTVTAEYSLDGGTTAIPVTGVSLAANGNSGGPYRAAQGTLVRPVLAGATSPSITVQLLEVV
jgi:hypothetical protein